MLKIQATSIFLVFFTSMPIVEAQAIFESGGVHASAAGLGAGMAASANHGKVVARSYDSIVQSQQAILAQTRAIEQYMRLGAEYETKKQWQNAEKSFRYVLQVSALRDGPGSEKTLPALKHLVTVCKAQNNHDDAVGFQKRVVGLTEAGKSPAAAFNAKIDLSNLFIEKEEYSEAEPVLAQSVEESTDQKVVPAAKRISALRSYATVLRKLKRDDKAQAIEESLAKEGAPVEKVAPGDASLEKK
jgi:tetratricopeptide (TPR) repeat protein